MNYIFPPSFEEGAFLRGEELNIVKWCNGTRPQRPCTASALPNTPGVATMADNCTNRTSARPTLPHQTPWSWDPKPFFWLKVQKNRTKSPFSTQQRRGFNF